MSSCLCEGIAVIDLTDVYKSFQSIDLCKKLLNALESHGFCYVTLNLARLPPKYQAIYERFEKSRFHAIFNDIESFTKENSSVDFIYRGRTSESGSPTASHAEPKQSLEIQRCRINVDHTKKLFPLQLIDAMHDIIVAIQTLLKLPHNVLIQNSSCDCNRNRVQKCNIDLMRMFLYDPVPGDALGSSPHTDWGSWTVVWQDDVGGLQTYCFVHEKFVDIPPRQFQNQVISFVVHVGDVTSLILGRCSSTLGSKVYFPSPYHRVVSPKEQHRVSLVYFAYPTPSITMNEIEQTLRYHRITKDLDAKVEYKRYYLLKNQGKGHIQDDPKMVFHRLKNKPMDECFREKWDQVQRSD